MLQQGCLKLGHYGLCWLLLPETGEGLGDSSRRVRNPRMASRMTIGYVPVTVCIANVRTPRGDLSRALLLTRGFYPELLSGKVVQNSVFRLVHSASTCRKQGSPRIVSVPVPQGRLTIAQDKVRAYIYSKESVPAGTIGSISQSSVSL